MAWVSANSGTAASIPGAINVVSPLGSMQIGRIDLKFANGTFKQIGKVYAGTLYYSQDGATFTTATSGFEILACLAQPATTTTLTTPVPTTTSTTATPCGNISIYLFLIKYIYIFI